MKDKLIIDGVDVSGCEYIFTTRLNPITLKCENTEPRCRYACSGWCKDNPDCHYKQSARKDERIRELELLSSQMTCSVEKLAHENGELKQKLSQIAELCDKFCYKQLSERIKSEFEEIKQIAQGE